MSFNKKTSSNYSGANNKMPAKKNGCISSYHGGPESDGSGRKKVVNDPANPPQNITPNKSGLTPIRPMKSPRTGMKLRSGLTPIRPMKSPRTGMKLRSGLTPVRPGVSQGLAKSPFSQEPKLKSGLLPIKPNVQTQHVDEFNCTSLIARRKSGLKPIKPGSTLPCHPSQGRNNISLLESKPFMFAAPKHIPKGDKSSDPAAYSALRRKSGLVPLKQFSFRAASGRPSTWKPPSAISNTSAQRSVPRIKISEPVESTPSLNVISEDSESPGNTQADVSGICQLDDSADMSVVFRPRTGKILSSRIPLPRTTLDSAHFSSSEITKTRSHKRVLYYPEDDETEKTCANVLKDGSSKANIVDGPSTSNKELSPKNLHACGENQTNAFDEEEKSLIRRKKELETAIQQMSSEVEEIDKQLRILQRERKDQSTHGSDDKESQDESSSPFADVVSPVSTRPLKLLTLAKSKQPDNIYKSYRQSCSFLKTPLHSAFVRPREPQLLCQQPEDSPNVSQRIQKQLVDLFAE